MTAATAGYDLAGLVDMHVHTAPDVTPRAVSDVALARAARAAGMSALMIKSHVTLTADRAAIAEQIVGGIRVCGGLTLNAAVGGLNPAAVEAALRMGARQIWMPTRDAVHAGSGRISVLTPEGALVPALYAILDLIRAHDATLGTGHIPASVSLVLVREARRVGVRKVLVTHPESASVHMDMGTQRAIAAHGAFFERCYMHVLPGGGAGTSIAEIAAHIRAVGVSSTVLSTDLGQVSNPHPVAGMRAYLSALARAGLQGDEIRRMAGDHPAYLLGL